MKTWQYISCLHRFAPRLRRTRGMVCRAGQGHRLLNGLVIGLYLLANIGLPVGGFTSAATASGILKGCRCSDSLKSAGRCCCAQRSATAAKRACCATKPAPSRSCCSTKSKPVEIRSEPESRESIAAVSECPCGPGDSSLFLVCAQPRILVTSVSAIVDAFEVEWLTVGSASPCGERERPTVPPPDVLV